MKEPTHRSCDILVKVFTLLAVAGGSAWAIVQHFDSKKREINATFWNKRMELYLEASEAASGISNAESPAEAEEYIRNFWHLYNGPMSVIETAPVKERMREFGGLVRRFQGHLEDSSAIEKPYKITNETLPNGLHAALQDGANRLANTMRESLKESWNTPFDF